MAKMFLMCGHCGSGKSTFAKQFAKVNGYLYLSIDEMYATFNGSPTDHSNKFDVWITFFKQIHAHEMAGHNIVVDTNAPLKTDRAEFLNWFSSFEHHLIWVDADTDLCLKNNQNRSRVIPEETMYKLFNFFETPNDTECISVGSRAKWQSISKVKNEFNKFLPRQTLCGKFPVDVRDLQEEI